MGIKRLDLQAKIVLVLIAVILPVFLVVTIIENQFTQPILEDEMKQIGITSGKTLAAEIVSQRLLTVPGRTARLESLLQEFLYNQPNVLRIDVVVSDPLTGLPTLIASNIEEEPNAPPQAAKPIVDAVTSEYKVDEESVGTWEISIPIEQKSRDSRGSGRILGNVHVVVSMKTVDHLVETLWKITATAAAVSVALLLIVLSYFLRKTINNDRLLRRAESQNLQLTEQLRDAERQLMNTEKLAAMGQLTASFAHEIGTPLNAIGGHMQLLQDEVGSPSLKERFDIINGQLGKVEGIVKGFLQSTAKPVSQRQLVDLNRLADQTLGIVTPRLQALGIEVHRSFDRSLGPIRVVPLDLEQIFLNLVNNSIDSLKFKAKNNRISRLEIELETGSKQMDGKNWAVVTFYDTGVGISRTDLPNVLKPFFTTKAPGEGTGLGLTICKELAQKYGGVLKVESKEGAWTRVTLYIPYELNG